LHIQVRFKIFREVLTATEAQDPVYEEGNDRILRSTAGSIYKSDFIFITGDVNARVGNSEIA